MSKSRRRIACVGEAMIELSLGAEGGAARVGYAGDTLNTAIYLRRGLPGDHAVDFVSVVGCDPLSDRMLGFIATEGVGTAHIRQHESRVPGLYAITTDAAGERSFTYWRDNSAARTLFSGDGGADFAALQTFDLVYYSAITLAILSDTARTAFFGWIDAYRAGGGEIAFDSNYRPRLWKDRATAREAVETAWRKCDLAFPSVDDEIALFGDFDGAAVLRRIEGYGCDFGALKRGGEGPLPIGVHPVELPLFRRADKVVDTTAAGDSFVGGFLAAYAQGRTIGEALLSGHNCAARVIAHPGAIVPLAVWNTDNR
ncbi:sugar kinase [Tropicimonas sp.]|uniref:sugar kinase n=1 Tax=Tropicimonas sp. TaxID=2067044 RepID=UPI003A882E61